jgi:hypothetical protein
MSGTDSGKNLGGSQAESGDQRHETRTGVSAAAVALRVRTASAGHPSLEAWLRSLRPAQLDVTVLGELFEAGHTLVPPEQAAVTDLFAAFMAEATDWTVFHPSLISASFEEIAFCLHEESLHCFPDASP